jgi:serine/threonine protein kinase
MRLQPGERLGPYEVTAWIASGGMGDLYKARDTRLNRTVAIKLLGADFAHDVEWRRRFDREAKTLAGLSHPHICVIHDVGEHQGERFLVLEYLEGDTLAERLARGPLPRELALRYAREIAGALDAAHRQGILHRDLKPSNVMLTKSGAKLLDFGIATLRAPASVSAAETVAIDRTSETAIVGTLPYLPPERLAGRPADERSDIFAFGAVLYEMLTGRPAFRGDSRGAVMAAVMNSEPEPDDRGSCGSQPADPAMLGERSR